MGHRGRRRVVVRRVDHDVDAVGRQHFQRTGKRRFGQRVRVSPEKQRTIDVLLFPVAADGLRDREDVPFVEGSRERRSSMA